MLSDTCFDVIHSLCNAIKEHKYSDDYRSTLISIIQKLNEIRDKLDDPDTKIALKDMQNESYLVAERIYNNAVKRRGTPAEDYWADVWRGIYN